MSGCPRTSKLESKVSPHIEEQLPEFVRSEHPLFATFVKHYYQFLEAGCLTLGGSNAVSYTHLTLPTILLV